MFYWMKRNPGGSEGLDSLGNMSKAEILRGIVTEKLTTAAQEILAVVERTMAGYEEEASGFRKEIARQRRQLEVLLQPQVKLERRGLVSSPDSHGGVVLPQQQQQQQQQQQAAVEDTGSLGLLWFDDDDDGDDGDQDGDEDELSLVQPEISSRKEQEDLKDPDYQIPSRSFLPRVQSDRRKIGRPPLDHLDFRIRILEDSHIDVLNNSILKKYQLQELQCPRGLQEADFLNQLRSFFPQLGSDKPFDIFTTDRSRRLQLLKVKTLTPEEISRSIRSSGARNLSLYIRLKAGEEPQTSNEDHQPQRHDDVPTDPASSSAINDPSETCTRFSSVGVETDKRRRGRPRLGEEPTHHLLKICILEDSESEVVSKNVSHRSTAKVLKCPRGLQEADFLELLRSTFPQLAGDNKPFNMFKADRSRKLRRLKVKTVTPEEINRIGRSFGGDKTFLYIRLKTGEEEDEEEDEEDEGLADDSQSNTSLTQTDQTGPNSSPVLTAESRSQEQDVEMDSAEDEDAADKDGGKVCDGDEDWKPEMAEDEDAADKDVGKVCDRDDDWKPDLEQQSSKRKRRPRSSGEERSKTPCKVCGVWYRILGSLIKHAWSHVDEPQCVCGICGEQFQSVEELQTHLRNYQKTHDCSFCGKAFFTVTGLNNHITLHTGNRPFKCEECNKTFAHMSSLRIHRWVHVADKPHKCDICPKAFGMKAQLRAHQKVHTGRDKYHCHICGKSVFDLRSLTRHRATHSGERRYSCEVCGKRFKILGTLRSHEKIHTVRERPYLCHICCKTFVYNCGLTAHMKIHSGERPFVCVICSKGFISNGERKAHMQIHTGEAPYGCSQCGRFFKRKSHLKNHVKCHLGIKTFVCAICGKACSRQEHLTVHMRTHNGERPYKCTLCDKAFTQSHCLKTHMKSHQGNKNQCPSPSTSCSTPPIDCSALQPQEPTVPVQL
ncbi:zinc finger protein 250-like isoform X2 [Mastacembelus armatus]|uniref:zinc finger protein 250-like isoform X2 n=1 Tax=Mastacembelus armatus TaxID=205130 RepID=UPI000E46338E|nr:zinc finger protein 250-like isoform X2 [Mastacembelus armatus]